MRAAALRSTAALLPALLLGALTVLTVVPTSRPVTPGQLQPVHWQGQPGSSPNRNVVATDLSAAMRAGLGLTSWPATLGDLSTAGAPEWWRDRCLNIGVTNVEQCRYGRLGAPRVLAVIGDSVAISWLPGLRKAAAREGWRIHVLTRSQCPAAAIPGGTSRAVSVSCAEHQRWAASEAVRIGADLIVISSRYGGATPAQWLGGMSTTLQRVAPAGARTVILSPPPDTGSIQRCRDLGLPPSRCALPVSSSYAGFSDAERTAAARYGVRFVDTRRWFCVNGICPALVSGLPVHYDGKHLSAAYSRRLRPHLEDALEPVG